MQNSIAGPQERQHDRGDRRHAAGEDGGAAGVVPDGEPILEDLEVRIVETGIDQAGFLARPRLPSARAQVEEILALLGRLEDEGRGQKDRWLQRALR